ncbi:acyl-CoA-binding domain-containing protein 5A isoform X2 [Salarias fasciatus]|uniref:Acyl-CoA-binding domain-containing protein 5 n=1 Tax=Salarias fasciatus TaxID=181472 RepID=A0A672FQZ9_SALFA|nr:acyl-CoA-binding domain-containing protein 5 isoform X2 [Salarias fasciatus]
MEVDTVRGEDEGRLVQQRFEAAVKVIKSLPPDGPFQPSNDMMLKFYSYYKQATVGVCNIPRPGFWDAVGKAKWDAWSSLGDMPKEEAMTAYVDEMKLILEGMPMTDEVEELLRVLGPFYELVEDKKKISQISDLSTGFSTMLNSAPPKSVTRSIVRTMEMNGTLETRPSRLRPPQEEAQEEEDDEEEEDEEEEDEEEEDDDNEETENLEIRKDKKLAQAKKKGSARRHKVPLANGKVLNGAVHLTNGSHSRAALNSDGSPEASPVQPQLNGHHTDPGTSGPLHVASDSDSEVYCDSVDQFGQEENLELNRSVDDLDEDDGPALEGLPEESQGPPQGLRCGGEDGEAGGAVSQRPRQSGDSAGGSLLRRGRGSRSPGLGSGSLMPLHGGGDGDGARRGGPGSRGGSLNEQIVVALSRLQEDMQSVLERLHTLEALTASQARSAALSPAYEPPPARRSRKPSWWPFDISPTSLAFAVIWPFVVQWLVRLYLQRRRRRIN